MIANNAAVLMVRAETANFSKKVRRMLGLGLEGWNDVLIVSLVVAFISAGIVAGATYCVIQLQRAENVAAKIELDEYKSEAAREIAEAQESAAEANQKAEEERLARIEIEQRIAPRRLDAAAQESLRTALKGFSGRIRIESYTIDAEGQMLALQLKDGLSPIFRIEDWIAAENPSGNLVRGINVSGNNKQLVDALVVALKAAGLSGVGVEPIPPPAESMLLLEESREKSPNVAAVVLVGVKPITQ